MTGTMLHRLPDSPDDLRGRRAARWVRESTAGQYDNWGPDAQAEQADRMIERYGLTDSGIAWQSAASGRTVHLRPEFMAMLDAARAGTFDILVVGYVSRFQRNLKQTLIAVDELHAAGVAVLFADERILSSDADRWDDFVREAHEAESYSRKLGKRIKEGLAAKRRRLGEPGGQPPYGYTRTGKPPVLDPIPAELERVRACFVAAAEGLTDAQVAEQVGLPFYTARGILTNPIYVGRLRDGTPTRVETAIEPGLWDRVQLARSRFSRRHPGRSTKWRTYALSMLYCASCGRHLIGQQNRYRHTFPCPTWLAAATPARRAFRHATDHRHKGVSYPADAFEGIVHQALGHVSANAALVADVVAGLVAEEAGPDPVTLARIEHDRDTAMSRYRRDRDGPALDETMRRLDHEECEAQAAHADVPTAAEAVAYLQDLPRLWEEAEGSGRRLLAEALFERIDVLGARKVHVHPSASARAQGWAEAWNGARLVVMVGARGVAPTSIDQLCWSRTRAGLSRSRTDPSDATAERSLSGCTSPSTSRRHRPARAGSSPSGRWSGRARACPAWALATPGRTAARRAHILLG
jgi:DNA invertase Pin-like site-specific DNA recombinase